MQNSKFLNYFINVNRDIMNVEQSESCKTILPHGNPEVSLKPMQA